MEVNRFKTQCVKALGLTHIHKKCKRIATRILSWFGGTETRKYKICTSYLRVSQYVSSASLFFVKSLSDSNSNSRRAGRGRDERGLVHAGVTTFFKGKQTEQLERKGLYVISSSHVDRPSSLEYVDSSNHSFLSKYYTRNTIHSYAIGRRIARVLHVLSGRLILMWRDGVSPVVAKVLEAGQSCVFIQKSGCDLQHQCWGKFFLCVYVYFAQF